MKHTLLLTNTKHGNFDVYLTNNCKATFWGEAQVYLTNEKGVQQAFMNVNGEFTGLSEQVDCDRSR